MFIYCEKKNTQKRRRERTLEHGRERAGRERERDGAMSAVVAGAPSSRASAYADWSKIGEGTFGVVYRAKLAGAPPPFRPASAARGEEEGQSATPKSTAAVAVAGLAIPTREPLQAGTSHVALKRIRANNARAGVDFTAIREIKMLGEMNHPNVIKLWECFESKGSVVLVLELCVTDVEEIIRDRNIDLTPAHVKSLVAQLLSATQYMHERWVLHRDLKPNNLLVDRRGVLKVTDFGLARTYGDVDARMTPTSVTRWYRPPELLYGSRNYGSAVDVWSVGCIFAELILRVPYLPGSNEIDQLETIFKARGSPTKDTWPNVELLPLYMAFDGLEGTPFQQINNPRARACTDDAVALMDSMLTFDPLRRPSAKTCLMSTYFSAQPAPASIAEVAALLPDGGPDGGSAANLSDVSQQLF